MGVDDDDDDGDEGARPSTGDAGKINFRAVHVVAQVAAHTPCRPVPADCVMAHAR